jgi:transcriptional regulator with XRE-family HTH domain
MNLGKRIKEIRTAKKMSQKEIALSIDLDRGQFSRIENNKVEPNLNTLKKIANTLKVSLAELFNEGVSYDIDSYNQSLIDRIKLISTLDEEQQEAIFFMIDTLSANQQLKTTLKNALNIAS